MSQSLCVISTRPPCQGDASKEALDAVLVAAVCDLSVSYLLMGDGVYQLLEGQSPSSVGRKNLVAVLSSLSLYGVETVHVESVSLISRGIDPTVLATGHTVLLPDQLPSFLASHDQVLTF